MGRRQGRKFCKKRRSQKGKVMSLNLNAVEGKVRAIGDGILVTHMHFGEQVTASGLIISDDDGKTRGIYPRWGCVYDKGPRNNEEYQVGDWVLVEHGRWTRSVSVKDGDSVLECRMIDKDAVLLYTDEKPEDVYIGNE